MATESYVQIAPDGTGKQIDAFTVGTSPTVYRQAVVIADPTTQGNAVSVTSGGAIIAADVYLASSTAGTTTLSTLDVNIAAATTSDAPIFTALVGDPTGDFAGVNLIEQVMRDESGLAINTRLLNPPKLDATGAAVPSDAIQIPLQGVVVGEFLVIDTTGYQSVGYTMGTLAASAVTASNDGVNWSAVTGIAVVLNSFQTAMSAASSYIFPAVARYLRITVSTVGIGTAYLRQTPCPMTYTNNPPITGATTAVTGGVAGSLAVGGNVAPGVARTQNPVTVSGTDSANLVRTLITSTAGALSVAGIDPTGTVRGVGVTPAVQAPQYLPSVTVQETSQFEGQGLGELLAQILTEMRIMNQQLFELPRLLNAGQQSVDEPSLFRLDPTIFVQ